MILLPRPERANGCHCLAPPAEAIAPGALSLAVAHRHPKAPRQPSPHGGDGGRLAKKAPFLLGGGLARWRSSTPRRLSPNGG